MEIASHYNSQQKSIHIRSSLNPAHVRKFHARLSWIRKRAECIGEATGTADPVGPIPQVPLFALHLCPVHSARNQKPNLCPHQTLAHRRERESKQASTHTCLMTWGGLNPFRMITCSTMIAITNRKIQTRQASV